MKNIDESYSKLVTKQETDLFITRKDLTENCPQARERSRMVSRAQKHEERKKYIW